MLGETSPVVLLLSEWNIDRMPIFRKASTSHSGGSINNSRYNENKMPDYTVFKASANNSKKI